MPRNDPAATIARVKRKHGSSFPRYQIDEANHFDRYDHLRFSPESDRISGYGDLIQLHNGLVVGITNFQILQQWQENNKDEALLLLHFRQEGNSVFENPDGNEIAVRSSSFTSMLYPGDYRRREVFSAEQTRISVTLTCPPQLLKTILKRDISHLPDPIIEYINRETPRYHYISTHLSLDMLQAVRALVATDPHAPLNTVYVEAKAMELLYLGLQSLALYREQGRGKALLSEQDISALNEVLEILKKSYTDPPTIGMLARAVGMNETKLCHEFKKQNGVTIFEFAHDLRMNRSRELLESTRMSISEIAYEIGYDYPGNFTAAFKRHFGVTPKAARQTE